MFCMVLLLQTNHNPLDPVERFEDLESAKLIFRGQLDNEVVYGGLAA